MGDLQEFLGDWQPLVRIVLILGGAILLRLTIKVAAKRVVRTVSKSLKSAQIKSEAEKVVAEARVLQRTRTMAAVFDRSASWAIWVTAAVMLLSEMGIEIGALIAVTTVLGAAIGFGAQSAVKDLIAGVFIIFEDQYGVGDWVELDGLSGEIERIGLRTTQLRDSHGTLWFVRNGEILKVGNSSQEWAKAVVQVGFETATELKDAEQLMKGVSDKLRDDPELGPLLLGDIEFNGVEQVGSGHYLVKSSIKTLPKKQWQVSSAIRATLLAESRRSGVVITEVSGPVNGTK